MRFSHLIQINDPLNPLIDPLSREQLWRGLVYRAENPLPFVLGLDECRIVVRTERTLRRELHFGSLTVRDRVTLDPMKQVRYETEAGAGLPASSLVMTIEEPGADDSEERRQQILIQLEHQSGWGSAGYWPRRGSKQWRHRAS